MMADHTPEQATDPATELVTRIRYNMDRLEAALTGIAIHAGRADLLDSLDRARVWAEEEYAATSNPLWLAECLSDEYAAVAETCSREFWPQQAA